MKIYSCDYCGKRFSAAAWLTRHRRIHTGDKPFVCDICGRGFNVKNNLRKHTYVENMTMTMYPDELQAAQQHMLKNHIHQCLVCGKIQPSPGKLERHMRIHTGEKPFKCDWCDYHSSRKDSMRKHHTRCVKKKEIEGQI
ncbi:ZBT49-like protein [Mya arenaria]|uniref:ZBT49-like protein n=1 Tax=Mya arenaria TaxID=6604 RepID=A0ABY7F4N4_MYAAR|nr:ZBT49-like protein [Mya arenaria]